MCDLAASRGGSVSVADVAAALLVGAVGAAVLEQFGTVGAFLESQHGRLR